MPADQQDQFKKLLEEKDQLSQKIEWLQIEIGDRCQETEDAEDKYNELLNDFKELNEQSKSNRRDLKNRLEEYADKIRLFEDENEELQRKSLACEGEKNLLEQENARLKSKLAEQDGIDTPMDLQ